MFKVKMVLEKETKGAVRYQEVGQGGSPLKGDEAIVGTLYIRKAAFNDGEPVPKSLTLSID